MSTVIAMMPPAARPAAEAFSRSPVDPFGAPLDRILSLRCGAGMVVHPEGHDIDALLTGFCRSLRGRGFQAAGFLQHDGENAGPVIDLASGCPFLEAASLDALGENSLAPLADIDLLIAGPFDAMGPASPLKRLLEMRIAEGLPVLSWVSGARLGSWQGHPGARRGVMIAPDRAALWQWWGPERLYQDLAQGVADAPVSRVVAGPRWVMVSGPAGSGVAFIPQNAKQMIARLSRYRQASLRQLAQLVHSWDGLDMAVGIAATAAHYNRLDLQADPGNGVGRYRKAPGPAASVGVIPGVADALPGAAILKHEPGPGDYPLEAMETLLPNCRVVIANSSNIANRKLPRILRLAEKADIALIGPSAPLTPRLFDYGVGTVGGLVVSDPDGLAQAIRAGAQPREFEQFGRYRHLCRAEPRSESDSAAMGRPAAENA